MEVLAPPPTLGHSWRLEVLNKRQSRSLSLSRNTQKIEISVDENLANDRDSTSIFKKVLGQKLSNSLSADIYLRFWTDFTSEAIGTEAPNFANLGLLEVNTLDEFNALGTRATRVRRPMYGSHWSAPGHVSGEVTAVGMRRTRSEQNYSYKTDFETRK